MKDNIMTKSDYDKIIQAINSAAPNTVTHPSHTSLAELDGALAQTNRIVDALCITFANDPNFDWS